MGHSEHTNLSDMESTELFTELRSSLDHRNRELEVSDPVAFKDSGERICGLVTELENAYLNGDLGAISHKLVPLLGLIRVALHDYGHLAFDLGREYEHRDVVDTSQSE